jgi:hypothetical protein
MPTASKTMTTASKIAVAFCTASVLTGSEWSFDLTLESATKVVVADIQTSSGSLDGGLVHEKATLRVVRVLKGDVTVGSELHVDWQAPEGIRVNPKRGYALESTGGLWFLRQNGDSDEPLQCTDAAAPVDRFLIDALPSAPVGVLSYTDDMPLESKVAREEASVLEFIARRNQIDFDTNPIARSQFVSITKVFRQFHPEAVTDIYHYFAASSNIYLRNFGLEGEGEPEP